MYDFAFITIAYNQENYIIQHLESIKNLVYRYGQNKKIQMIFCDDNSIDSTLKFANEWFKRNENLFDEISIINHEENVGTIRNIYSGLEICKAKELKVCAGDDLFYNNDIFSLLGNYDAVITPVIPFTENGIIEKDLDSYYIRLMKARSKKEIQNLFSYAQVVAAPGVFFSKDIWTDKRLKDFLFSYKYVEDYPMWHYLLNMYNRDIEIKVVEKPYVLYRTNSGISHKKNSVIEDEILNLQKNIPKKKYKKPRWLNVNNYLDYIVNNAIELFDKHFDDKIKKANGIYIDEVDRSRAFLKQIDEKKNDY